tara:strand:- start:341 stop:493 length:153 start_codon:yes stop_codon:yes gene_type:complete
LSGFVVLSAHPPQPQSQSFFLGEVDKDSIISSFKRMYVVSDSFMVIIYKV